MRREHVQLQLIAASAAALLLAGCSRNSMSPARPESATEASAPARYLALGDSYTIGESVPMEARWPVQLVELLRRSQISIADPEIIAKTGWTTDELDRAIDPARPTGPYDLVTLLIGVNNQYRGRDAEEYRGQFASLLKRAIAFAGGSAQKVVVLAIPDWGVTPFAAGRDQKAIAAALDRYNAIARAETEAAGASFVDTTEFSRRAATDRSLIAADGLHPSEVMYAEWARLALGPAQRALASRR